MGRPVKDYWNWIEISIPYTGGWDYPSAKAAEEFLQQNLGENEFEIRVTTAYPTPRKRYSMKTINSHVYFIKDEQIASLFALKFS